MNAPLPEDVIRQALTASKIVYRQHVNVGYDGGRAVMKFHVEPFAADPQYVIGKLYQRCADLGVPMAGIQWGAVSHRFPGCQTFRFSLRRLGETS